jgi:hypothetical protein
LQLTWNINRHEEPSEVRRKPCSLVLAASEIA